MDSVASLDLTQMEFDRTLANMRHLGKPEDYIFSILCRMEFTTDRRRMSVLVKDPRDNLLKLYVKGADDVIRERLNREN